ncbi:MAG: hypothetical protein MI976_29105 [Pseudomonadales bacterium]|nr:hypothetical protein [Pseudomonadales bacterium]
MRTHLVLVALLLISCAEPSDFDLKLTDAYNRAESSIHKFYEEARKYVEYQNSPESIEMDEITSRALKTDLGLGSLNKQERDHLMYLAKQSKVHTDALEQSVDKLIYGVSDFYGFTLSVLAGCGLETKIVFESLSLPKNRIPEFEKLTWENKWRYDRELNKEEYLSKCEKMSDLLSEITQLLSNK